ncbi:formylglycine-generating enzyme required for sulfatase activity [Parabacteroides sp. PF5-5]|uniref:formylglycine-generating enzyme family protein n=1 Tax=unclassified Parabacteroides TaxID=2649774 RepID=UPI002473C3CE|nr:MULTISPECIES: formylglycine-generating enzyme family protein [unclassified Parabacteroides]MDH6304853.1 formylglycine-generating enzyme required for sulfatase activity [Parabacteroides sp. PH5-39]MDH6316061.1 formylglycine-generating enzyme required for sulfatase activity [Parabacteroides sp. PF5-13]MDH6319718.1 formylglycine-generating enzyme required for sulfatase activity [Parabacteroides sp. PH5-13]MDH6323449.1 formylglycine-generating enzyme required for sulfatase activity [Parabacteroi
MKTTIMFKHTKPCMRLKGILLLFALLLLPFLSQSQDIEMVAIEGGTFTMGATSEQGDEADDDEYPVHQVTLDSYYIGKYEVTQLQWKQVMGNNPSYFKDDRLPVENVNWDDIQEFIAKLNAITGKKYRLPTEAEWEYAARGGNKGRGYQYSGSYMIEHIAWYDDNSGKKPNPVGTKGPNELGIYDMTGNVWELCHDWYGAYDKEPQTNPTGASTGEYRVLRGGSWYTAPRGCRVSIRLRCAPFSLNTLSGFRLAL